MNDSIFPDRSLDQLLARPRNVLDDATMQRAAEIVTDVERGGEEAALRHAARFDGYRLGDTWLFDRAALTSARHRIPVGMREDLEAAAARIELFAHAQRAALTDIDVAVPGGRAGHTVLPVQRAGCYAPAGRFPLPSSLLMGAVTARAAGVREVWVASPRPSDTMLAAAAIAGADGMIGLGGAQAIAALAFGIGPVAGADVVVGPGNRWVTAAKQAVSGRVGIDFLAGPSELVVLADHTASPDVIAADLMAQAEHDTDALPILVTTEAGLVHQVREALRDRLESLPSAAVAREALLAGGAIVARDLEDAIGIVDRMAPEHLQLSLAEPAAVASRIGSAGTIFVGEQSAEVFGDYGAGPNHVLPTGGGARFTAGLSVFTFLRARTWLRIGDPSQLSLTTARLARLEGLEGHARAAEARG